MLKTKSGLDRVDEVINRLAVGLNDDEVADCVYRLFGTPTPFEILGEGKAIYAYFAIMKRLHKRITAAGSDDLPQWLVEKQYWPPKGCTGDPHDALMSLASQMAMPATTVDFSWIGLPELRRAA